MFTIISFPLAHCDEGRVKLSMYEADYVPLHENSFPSYYFIKDELARGRVDICYNGSYESVCSDSWKEEEASVICQQLGFSKYGKGFLCSALSIYIYVCIHCSKGAVAISSGIFGASGEPPSNEILCTGNESSILECTNTAVSHCQLPHEAGVICQGMHIL